MPPFYRPLSRADRVARVTNGCSEADKRGLGQGRVAGGKRAYMVLQNSTILVTSLLRSYG
jgi:hypothetical protein